MYFSLIDSAPTSAVSRQLSVKMAVSKCEVYLWFRVEIKSILTTKGKMSLDNRIHTDSDQRVATSYQDLNLNNICCPDLVS